MGSSLSGRHPPTVAGGQRPQTARTAVVLPGGGAHGAYEVGALEVLLAALERRGERVSVWCGTSVGAINAAAMASRAQLPACEQVGQVAQIWHELRKRDVLSRLRWHPGTPRDRLCGDGTRTGSRDALPRRVLIVSAVDNEFTRALMEMGRRDANRWLRRHPQFWCRDASHDVSLGQLERSRVIEQDVIDEFRAHRRH